MLILEVVLNQELKFAKVFTVCRQVASWVSELGMGDFNERYQHLCNLLESWQSGVRMGKQLGNFVCFYAAHVISHSRK